MLTKIFSHHFFSTRRGEQLGAAFILLFGLATIAPIIQTVLLFHPKHFAALPTQSPTFASIQNIPNWHLFGQATDEKNIPLTTLNLQLLGIFYEADHSSAALISDAGQPSKLYKIGDNLPEGATLVKILRYSILLNNNGRIERLPLPIKKLPLQKE